MAKYTKSIDQYEVREIVKIIASHITGKFNDQITNLRKIYYNEFERNDAIKSFSDNIEYSGLSISEYKKLYEEKIKPLLEKYNTINYYWQNGTGKNFNNGDDFIGFTTCTYSSELTTKSNTTEFKITEVKLNITVSSNNPYAKYCDATYASSQLIDVNSLINKAGCSVLDHIVGMYPEDQHPIIWRCIFRSIDPTFR